MSLFKNLERQASNLKKGVQVLVLAYTDKRTPLTAKLLIWLTLGYFFSPIDLIPDFIPVLGVLDDLVIVPLLISISIKLIPAIVIAEARQQLAESPMILKKSNWLFAAVIVAVWVGVLYGAYRWIRAFWI